MYTNSVVLFLAEKDFDEQEFLVIKKNLVNNKFNVFICSDSNSVCIGNNGLKVKNDIILPNLKHANFAGIIIIGGKGIVNYFNNFQLISSIKDFNKNKKIIAAICAAPIIIAKSGILEGKSAACNINYKKELEKEAVIFSSDNIVETKNIITAQNSIDSTIFISKTIMAIQAANSKKY